MVIQKEDDVITFVVNLFKGLILGYVASAKKAGGGVVLHLINALCLPITLPIAVYKGVVSYRRSARLMEQGKKDGKLYASFWMPETGPFEALIPLSEVKDLGHSYEIPDFIKAEWIIK